MRLDKEILKIRYGVSYGSVTLKSLQNDNVPELDLLVREAIQNSSDASLGIPDEKSFSVSFNEGKFEPKKFNTIMTGIEDILDHKYTGQTAEFLEIRDTKTCGLTGKTRLHEIYNNKDDHGNFFKLIYDTGKKQVQTKAGGNWGFGKSVYYRVGIGIVVFYSRIKEDSDYEDRLIITLVEDENKRDLNGNDATILNAIEPASAGKAWWGLRSEDKEDLLPLTDLQVIQEILSIFGLKPFNAGETGTSIIIPYINAKGLLNGIIPLEADIKDDVRAHLISNYTSSISDYLWLAVQKWYAPKIHNREIPKICGNKWLKVSINNKPITKDELLSFFQLTQELYTSALASNYKVSYDSKIYPKIKVLPVRINNCFESNNIAGYVSMIQINTKDLINETSPLSPYSYLGKYEVDGGLNEPIVMYTRDPGMVIDYLITGPWVKNLAAPENPDDYLFAFFVPNTENQIRNDLSEKAYAGMYLGEYLRVCEASDHMEWNDPVPMEIVTKIRRNTGNAIGREIKNSLPIIVDANASKLSNRLGKNLLPKIGYGKHKDPNGDRDTPPGTKAVNYNFAITSQTIRENEVIIDYTLKLSHGKKTAKISMMIASEGGKIDARTWAKDIGTVFPIEIAECYIKNVNNASSDKSVVTDWVCNVEKHALSNEYFGVSLCRESATNPTTTQVLFETHILNPIIIGKLRLKTYDKKYRFTFRIE